jgi:hypothetical protein
MLGVGGAIQQARQVNRSVHRRRRGAAGDGSGGLPLHGQAAGAEPRRPHNVPPTLPLGRRPALFFFSGAADAGACSRSWKVFGMQSRTFGPYLAAVNRTPHFIPIMSSLAPPPHPTPAKTIPGLGVEEHQEQCEIPAHTSPAGPLSTAMCDLGAGDIRMGVEHYSGGARQRLAVAAEKRGWDTSVMRINPKSMSTNFYSPDYAREMRSATFCFCPYGFGWGIRILAVRDTLGF